MCSCRNVYPNGSWVSVSMTTIRKSGEHNLKMNEYIDIYTDNSTNSIYVEPLALECTGLKEGGVSQNVRYENGKKIYRLTPVNCNATFRYRVYQYV